MKTKPHIKTAVFLLFITFTAHVFAADSEKPIIKDINGNGLDSKLPLKMDTPRPTPIVEMPCNIHINQELISVFRWTKTEQTKFYHFQLSRDEMFSVLLFDLKMLSNNEFRPRHLKPGEYYWRVARVDFQGVEGPISDIIKCFIPEPEKEEEPEPVNAENDADADATGNDADTFVTVPDIDTSGGGSDNPATTNPPNIDPPVVDPAKPPSPS